MKIEDFIGWKIIDVVETSILGYKKFMVQSPDGKKELLLEAKDKGKFAYATFEDLSKANTKGDKR